MPARNTRRNIIEKLKTYLGGNFPLNIDRIIIFCGYDTELALSNINEEDIKEIEFYVNENKQILKNEINDIRDDQEFKLKPGHKKFILGLPKKIKELKNKNKNNGAKNKEIETDNIIVQFDQTPDDQFKQKLITKIKQFCAKKSVPLDFNYSNINKWQQVNGKPKCKISCCLCGSEISYDFISYWRISNLQDHLKGHFKTIEIEVVDIPLEANSTNLSVSALDTNTQIHSYANTHGAALERILNEE